MEIFLGLVIIIEWFAIVIWGAASLVLEAKQTKNWEKVWLATISAATVSGPLLTLMPDHVFFGGHTMGLGYILAMLSGGAILLTRPQVQRICLHR
jgi:hypothetical protein